MRIVELNAVLRREVADVVAVMIGVVAQHVLQAGRCQEILLPQPQFVTLFVRRIGVQHHGDVFGQVLRLDRVEVTAGIEFLEVELVRRRGRPQAQRIDDAVLIARDRDIVRNRQHVMRVGPRVARVAPGVLVGGRAATELDRLREFIALDFPRKTLTQPGIRLFDLVAIVDALPEHAVLVADPVADDG